MLDKVKEGVLLMKTHELEKELGISKHTIFYYEKEGIITPQRDDNGYRSYSQEDLQKLIMVKFLRNLNISIDDVKAILNNELDFKECLEINQIHLEKQIKSLEEVQENIEMYVRKDLKKLALRKFLYKIPAAITPSFIMWICAASFFDENLEKTTSLIIIFILLMILFINIFVATEFQFSQIWLKMPLDQTMNQSVEFLSDGIRYYQFHGYLNNLKYYYGVLFNKAEKYMQSYKYEDIQSVELILNHRYESYGTPIAKDWYVLDYRFEFKDGNHFYFYWPITLDDDSRFIGTILDEKVENIIDKDHVIDALKNGIHLNDYVRGTEE